MDINIINSRTMPENRELTPQPEKDPSFVRMDIIAGHIGNEYDKEPGKPLGYFVRAEGTTDTLNMKPGSVEYMAKELFGSDALDFISGYTQTSDDVKRLAEEMRDRINDPVLQKKIRALFSERQKLSHEFFGD